MKNMSIVELAEITASKCAVPGGGSMAALCGALAAALVEMVTNLTIGNKKYTEVEEKMEKLRDRALNLRKELLDDIARDSEAYAGVMNAYKLPKITEDEKKNRRSMIQDCLKNAVLIPLEIASKGCQVIDLSKEVVQFGNKNAVSDGMVSAMMARTAVLAAILNAKINLGSIKDEDFVSRMAENISAMEQQCIEKEAEILNSVAM